MSLPGRSHFTVARELAPDGLRSNSKIPTALIQADCMDRFGPAAQSSGSKLPRHRICGDFRKVGAYSAHFVSRITPLFGSRLTNLRDSRRKSRCIRLLKNCRIANLRAFYDPLVTGSFRRNAVSTAVKYRGSGARFRSGMAGGITCVHFFGC